MADGSWLLNSFFKLPIIKVCFESLGVGEYDADRMTGFGNWGGFVGLCQNSSPDAFFECGTVKSFVSHH